MSAKKIAIAYCADNEQVVKQIEQQLSLSGYQFQPFVGTKSTANAPLSDQLLNQPDPILLVVSDNFLKAAQCMFRGLKLLHEKRNQILPIVIEGVTEDEQTGKAIKVQTDFERVSDIIQYINYWQDQYLDLRRQKRQMKDFDEKAFNAHLKTMREISSEAGEFLRVLRGMNYLIHEDFTANSYEKFFEFNDDPDAWKLFKGKAPAAQASTPADRPVAEELPAEVPAVPPVEEQVINEVVEEEPALAIEEAINEVLEEVSVSPLKETIIEKDPPPIDISEIPGMDMIADEPVEEEVVDVEEELPPPPAEEVSPIDEESSKEDIASIIASGVEEAGLVAATPEEIPISEEEDENAGETFYLDDDEDDSLNDIEDGQPVDTPEEEEVEPVEEGPVTVLIEQALDYFNAGQVKEGLAFMEQAVNANPDNLYLRYHYALMLAQRDQDYLSAREQLAPVVQAEPEHEHALFLMGELNELLEDFAAARNYYLQLIDLNPKYPNAYYRLGMIMAAQFEGKHKAASKYLKKAIKLDRKNADACYQYALLLNEGKGKPKQAIGLLKKTLKIDPQHPFANYDLALAYYQMGRRSKAKKAYAQAIAINPELHTPENDLAFQEKQATTPVSVIDPDPLNVLKDNINDLEELLKAKEEEVVALRQEMEEAGEKILEKTSEGRTALITGATSGIGKATAEIFADNGYRVIITGRRANRLKVLKSTLEEGFGADVLAIAFDVRDEKAVEDVLEKLGEKDMEVDILINNAGKAKGLAPIHEGRLEHWEEMIDTNLKGLLYMTRAVSPGMVRRKSGHIINVSSTAGRDVYPNGNVYCATKAAVEALTKAMRLDLHQHNVRVSMVSPAHVDETEFALVRFDGNEEKARIYEEFKPLSSRDVAEAIFFMATRPAHVNVLDVVLQGIQQASSLVIDRSGREKYEEEEE